MRLSSTSISAAIDSGIAFVVATTQLLIMCVCFYVVWGLT